MFEKRPTPSQPSYLERLKDALSKLRNRKTQPQSPPKYPEGFHAWREKLKNSQNSPTSDQQTPSSPSSPPQYPPNSSGDLKETGTAYPESKEQIERQIQQIQHILDSAGQLLKRKISFDLLAVEPIYIESFNPHKAVRDIEQFYRLIRSAEAKISELRNELLFEDEDSTYHNEPFPGIVSKISELEGRINKLEDALIDHLYNLQDILNSEKEYDYDLYSVLPDSLDEIVFDYARFIHSLEKAEKEDEILNAYEQALRAQKRAKAVLDSFSKFYTRLGLQFPSGLSKQMQEFEDVSKEFSKLKSLKFSGLNFTVDNPEVVKKHYESIPSMYKYLFDYAQQLAKSKKYKKDRFALAAALNVKAEKELRALGMKDKIKLAKDIADNVASIIGWRKHALEKGTNFQTFDSNQDLARFIVEKLQPLYRVLTRKIRDITPEEAKALADFAIDEFLNTYGLMLENADYRTQQVRSRYQEYKKDNWKALRDWMSKKILSVVEFKKQLQKSESNEDDFEDVLQQEDIKKYLEGNLEFGSPNELVEFLFDIFSEQIKKESSGRAQEIVYSVAKHLIEEGNAKLKGKKSKYNEILQSINDWAKIYEEVFDELYSASKLPALLSNLTPENQEKIYAIYSDLEEEALRIALGKIKATLGLLKQPSVRLPGVIVPTRVRKEFVKLQNLVNSNAKRVEISKHANKLKNIIKNSSLRDKVKKYLLTRVDAIAQGKDSIVPPQYTHPPGKVGQQIIFTSEIEHQYDQEARNAAKRKPAPGLGIPPLNKDIQTSSRHFMHSNPLVRNLSNPGWRKKVFGDGNLQEYLDEELGTTKPSRKKGAQKPKSNNQDTQESETKERPKGLDKETLELLLAIATLIGELNKKEHTEDEKDEEQEEQRSQEDKPAILIPLGPHPIALGGATYVPAVQPGAVTVPGTTIIQPSSGVILQPGGIQVPTVIIKEPANDNKKDKDKKKDKTTEKTKEVTKIKIKGLDKFMDPEEIKSIFDKYANSNKEDKKDSDSNKQEQQSDQDEKDKSKDNKDKDEKLSEELVSKLASKLAEKIVKYLDEKAL